MLLRAGTNGSDAPVASSLARRSSALLSHGLPRLIDDGARSPLLEGLNKQRRRAVIRESNITIDSLNWLEGRSQSPVVAVSQICAHVDSAALERLSRESSNF